MKLRNTSIARLILIQMVAFCCMHSVNAQLTIKGKFTIPEAEGMEMSVIYCPDYYALLSPPDRGTRYTTKVQNGEFTINVDKAEPFHYLTFSYGDFEKFSSSVSWGILVSKLFLTNKDGLIEMTISKDSVIFSEKNPLFASQYEMYHYAYTHSIPIDETMEDLVARKANTLQLILNQYVEQLHILNRYEPVLGQATVSILRQDFGADMMLTDLANIDFAPNDTAYSKENIANFQHYINNYFLKEHFDTVNAIHKVRSRSCIKYLFRRNLYDMGLMMMAASGNIWPSFSQMADRFAELYSGDLKEKLIAHAFVNYTDQRSEPSPLDFTVASRHVKNREYRSIIERIKKSKAVGQPAFNFQLKDSSGKTVTQDSFKGKVVILDFWFTGCGGCSYLNKHMTPIYNYYKNNRDVVFVTIALDKDMNSWKRYGLKSGLYTHEGSVNLYTNGEGENHPLIKYYGVMEYPTLIIIDRQGKVVSRNPPKPIAAGAQDRFIALVNQYL